MSGNKIIFANRSDCFEKFGGDTLQMMKTKEFLEKLFDVDIKVVTSPLEIINNNDAGIVHIFNIETKETSEFIEACKSENKKIVVSTINWDYSHAMYVKYLAWLNIYPFNRNFAYFKTSIIKLFNLIILINPMFRKLFAKYLSKGMYGTEKYIQNRRKALIDADVIIPNSFEELEKLSNEYKINYEELKNKACVVPNAVDADYIKEQGKKNNKHELPENYVLEVGRIDPVKNQLNIVRALYDLPHIPIVFVGRAQDKKYYDNLVKVSKKRGNVYFIEEIANDDVYSFYKKAGCHILPSFKETTGLVTLEALFSGCQAIVASEDFCPVKYYEFDKYCYLCNPYDLLSIKKAILNALQKPKDIKPVKDYIYKVSYENVAELTYNVYLQFKRKF